MYEHVLTLSFIHTLGILLNYTLTGTNLINPHCMYLGREVDSTKLHNQVTLYICQQWSSTWPDMGSYEYWSPTLLKLVCDVIILLTVHVCRKLRVKYLWSNSPRVVLVKEVGLYYFTSIHNSSL